MTSYIKAPHHGSAYQGPGFLAASGARLALISVGADNEHGHPAPSTLRRLRSLDMTIRRTDTDGAIAVVSGDDGLGTAVRGR